ncbi:hypothetical protein SK128_016367, partial [Halocaridina rubra]
MYWRFIGKLGGSTWSPRSRDSSQERREENIKDGKREIDLATANKWIHTVATLAGFHIITRKENVYEISRKKLIFTVLFFCNIAYAVGIFYYLLFHGKFTWLQLVLLFPAVFTWGSCSYSCILLLRRSRMIIHFLCIVEKYKLTIKAPKYFPWTMGIIIVYASIYTTCLVVSKKVIPYEYYPYFIHPTFLSSIMPALIDIYVLSFTTVIVASLQKLNNHIRSTSMWVTEEITTVAKFWLRIHRLLDKYNE